MGKIGKPQRSGKHKKIKFVDPFYLGDRKERMYGGHDQAPKSTEQEVSRRFKDFMHSTKHAQNLKGKTRKQRKEYLKKLHQAQQLKTKADDTMPAEPEFQQKKGESEATFMRRVDMETKHVIRESQIEAKFKIDRTPAAEVPEKRSTKKKERDKEKKQKKKEKLREKKEEKQGDYRMFTDKVEFGEVVHAPPALKALPRHAQKTEKPWVKSLLANDILRDNATQNAGYSMKSSQMLGKGTKRKLLSPARQERMDAERQHAIDVYRQLKKSTLQ